MLGYRPMFGSWEKKPQDTKLDQLHEQRKDTDSFRATMHLAEASSCPSISTSAGA
jgi:hypothetical protein